ncbi:MAG TPA: hypothetical protein VM221_08775 [Armatimonadota bacterium]|nr:hypothetical protein [Armatimonadota bacterium]
MAIIAPQTHLVKPSAKATGKPSKQPAAKPLSYRIEATEPSLTGFGGAGLLAQFLQRLGLPQSLAALPNLPRTRYPAARFLLGLLYGLVLDRSRRAHVAELGDDAVFPQLTGLAALPSQSAFSRFLAPLRTPTAQALLATNRALVAKVRKLGSPAGGLGLLVGMYPPTPPENVDPLCDAMEEFRTYWWEGRG